MKIVIFGYYNKFNYGDQVFKHVLEKYICRAPVTLDVKNIDQLKATDLTAYQKVLVGCGDIVNQYFLSQENLDILSKCAAPVIFLGIGIQYVDYIYSLDVGDLFVMRNKTDYKLLLERYPDNVMYIPDLAHFLTRDIIIQHATLTPVASPNKLKVGLCIPYPWVAQNDMRSRMFFGKLVELVKTLSDVYDVMYIPFDTSEYKQNSDNILGRMLKDATGVSVYTRDDAADYIQDMLALFDSMDIIIASRFHSLILSIVTCTPFISLFTSQKILKLKADLPSSVHKHFFQLEQSDGEPVNIPVQSVVAACDRIKCSYARVQGDVTKVCQGFDMMLDETLGVLQDIMEFDPSSLYRKSPPRYISTADRRATLNAVVKAVLQVTGKNNLQNVNALLKFGSLANFIPKTTSARNEAIKKRISEEILWIITGDPYAPYYYGLFENLFTGSFIDKINWMIDDYYKKYYYEAGKGVCIINKNFQNIHRSGWQYVINNIEYESVEPVIIDTYIDKTFHWNKEFYTSKGVIPYKAPWVGVIHHTFSDYTNSYNCHHLLRNDLFLQSLASCKTLIVMSEYLAQKMREEIEYLGCPLVDITVMTHPTEDPQLKFRWDLFEANQEKKLVNIGSWLRNMFTIYSTMLPDDSWVSQKCILKNKNSNNYFAPPDLFDRLGDHAHDSGNCLDMCRTSFENMHVKGLYDYIYKLEHSVRLLEYLPNHEYDALLTDNVVFVDYIDASATNTLVECVMRNTPIIVNKIPAVVEVLGEDYPLYYTTPYNITKLLEKENIHLVREAYDFLASMDKEKFGIDYFSKQFNDILNTNN